MCDKKCDKSHRGFGCFGFLKGETRNYLNDFIHIRPIGRGCLVGVERMKSSPDFTTTSKNKVQYYQWVQGCGHPLTGTLITKSETILSLTSDTNIFSQYTCLYKILRSPLPSLSKILSLPYSLISFGVHSGS